ncbi:MAG: FAD-dependent oxidoreductase [Acidobacteriota bacterium]
MGYSIQRREFLKQGAFAGAALGAGLKPADAALMSPDRVIRTKRKFAKVNVSWDRVIRISVGLRPHRLSGFLVKAERLGDKIVVHNYGHGGDGVTLSWGTSHLAVEEALRTAQTRYAVIGCGAVGLATARLLQQHGFDVTIYAKDLPLNTTSNHAGAVWDAGVPRDAKVRDLYMRAARLSHRYFQEMVGDSYGVRWIEKFSQSTDKTRRIWSEDPLHDLYPDFRELGRKEHPFPPPYVVRWFTMLIEPPIYLNAVLRDFLLAGGRIVVRDFPDLKALLELPEPVIMNCTGLGAKALFGDQELMPNKGQYTVLLPQPEIDYITGIAGDMVPRKDGILLGGTSEPGVWTLEPNQEAMQRIMNRHVEFFNRMK